MTTFRRRAGVTLIELLIVLSVLAIITSVAALSARVIPPGDETSPPRRIMKARERATSLGRTELLFLRDDSGRLVVVRALPDGGVIGARSWLVNRTTGERPRVQH